MGETTEQVVDQLERYTIKPDCDWAVPRTDEVPDPDGQWVSYWDVEVTIATLIAERDRALAALDAMQAERDAAAEDERDRLLVLASREARAVTLASPVQGGVNRPYHAHLWLAENGAVTPIARSVLRDLATQEKPHG